MANAGSLIGSAPGYPIPYPIIPDLANSLFFLETAKKLGVLHAGELNQATVGGNPPPNFTESESHGGAGVRFR